MKKMMKVAAACAVALTLLSANAVAKKDKGEATKKEKPAKEKPAKAEKAKPVKKVKFDQAKFDAAYSIGDYATCAGMLLGKADKNTLVKDMLDADMLLYLGGDYQNAGKGFLETYGTMQQVRAEMDAGKSMAAAMGGENSIKYTGTVYERYLDWSMRLATALGNKQYDVAGGIVKDYTGTFMAEIQALQKQEEEIAAASENSKDSDQYKKAKAAFKLVNVNEKDIDALWDKQPDKPTEADKYDKSPFFSYLGTLAWAVNDDFDHAEEFADKFGVSQAKDITKVPAGKGRLEVVALSGQIGKREDASANVKPTEIRVPNPVPALDVPYFSLYAKVSYPKFDAAEYRNNHAINGVRVTLSDGQSQNATVIEDFDLAVEKDVKQKARAAYSRSVFRNVVKNSVTAGTLATAIAGALSGNKIAVAAANIVILGLPKAVEAIVNLERADVRQGVYFPHMASAKGFNVEPGTYTVTVEYLNGSDVVETKTIENVVVDAGKVSVAVSACEK